MTFLLFLLRVSQSVLKLQANLIPVYAEHSQCEAGGYSKTNCKHILRRANHERRKISLATGNIINILCKGYLRL